MDFFKQKLNDVQDFLAEKNFEDYHKMAQKCLSVAAQVGQAQIKGPLGLAALGIGVVGDVRSFLTSQSSVSDIFDTYVDQNKVFLVDSHAIVMPKNPKRIRGLTSEAAKSAYISAVRAIGHCLAVGIIEQYLKKVSINDNLRYDLYKMTLPCGQIAFLMISKDVTGEASRRHIENYYIAVPENFDTKPLKKMLGEHFSYDIVFHDDFNAITMFQGARSLVVSDEYRRQWRYEDHLVRKYHAMRAAGVSPAALLYGPAGSGKTSGAVSLSRRLGGYCMAFTAKALRSQTNNIIVAIRLVHPKVVLFDDIDEVGENSILSLVEQCRLAFPETFFLSATNYIEKLKPSLRRPGRLGARVYVGCPSPEEAVEFMNNYSASKGWNQDFSDIRDKLGTLSFDWLKSLVQIRSYAEGSEFDKALADAIQDTKDIPLEIENDEIIEKA